MQVIHKIIYKEIKTDKKFEDVDAVINKLKKEKDLHISYFFEMDETDDAIILANVYAFDLKEGEDSRFFQVETATIDKKTLVLKVHGDNVGLGTYKMFNNIPVWTMEELYKYGITSGGDADVDYKHLDLTY